MDTKQLLNELRIRRNRQAHPVHRIRRTDQPINGMPVDKYGRLIPAMYLKQGDEYDDNPVIDEEIIFNEEEQLDLLEEFGEGYDNHDNMVKEINRRYGAQNLHAKHFSDHPKSTIYFHYKTGFPVASWRHDTKSGSIHPEHEFHKKVRINEDINGGSTNVNSRPVNGSNSNMKPVNPVRNVAKPVRPRSSTAVRPVSNVINSGDDQGEFNNILNERLSGLLESRRIHLASRMMNERNDWLGDDYDRPAKPAASKSSLPDHIKFVDAGGVDKRGRKSPWTDKHDLTSHSSGKTYRIAYNTSSNKWGCSCPDWIYRKQHSGQDCKHINEFKLHKGISEEARDSLDEAYTHINFKAKKHLKDAIARGDHVEVFQPGGMGNVPRDGNVAVEGPHYPAPHSWYASVTLKDGRIVKVK